MGQGSKWLQDWADLEDPGLRWWHRKTLNSHTLRNIFNLYFQTEQFTLKNKGLTEQFLHNKQERETIEKQASLQPASAPALISSLLIFPLDSPLLPSALANLPTQVYSSLVFPTDHTHFGYSPNSLSLGIPIAHTHSSFCSRSWCDLPLELTKAFAHFSYNSNNPAKVVPEHVFPSSSSGLFLL